MKSDIRSRKILITGLAGFTGNHLSKSLGGLGHKVYGLKANLLDRQSVIEEVSLIQPDYVIHLAAKSFVGEKDISSIYRVNVEGTINLLDSIKNLSSIQKVILASSATVYGNQNTSVLTEDLIPKPVNHYGCSKLAMEHMSQNYSNELPILITRPFNYTGIGQANNFLIPKIVEAYKSNSTVLELGNLDVYREFNDIRDVCKIYSNLLFDKNALGLVNMCSGKSIALKDIIRDMNDIANVDMTIQVNPAFLRPNEIKELVGGTCQLEQYYDIGNNYEIKDTLISMYQH